MDPIILALLGLGALFALVFIGLPIAYAAALTGFSGIAIMRGFDTAVSMVGIVPFANSAHYTLSVVPLFIIIGFLALRAGITSSAYSAARTLVGSLPGGLATATIFASAGFAAVSGASTASTSVFTRISIPEMEARGYSRTLAAGVVAVGGTLAALIPPSAILVLYGILAEVSIAKLLVAGLIPGLLSIIVYLAVIFTIVKIRPEMAPVEPSTSFKEKLQALPQLSGILLVVLIILIGLYFGWTTPTESAALATAVTFIMALAKRPRLSEFDRGIRDAIQTVAMIFLVIWGVMIFVRFLAFSGLPAAATSAISDLDMPRGVILFMIILLYLFLGMVVDGIGMMMLTLPVILPAIVALDYDPIWFGILLVKLIEIGVVTPPVGLNCYVVNGIRPDIPLETVFKGVAPFLIGEIIIVAIIVFLPELVLFLPSRM